MTVLVIKRKEILRDLFSFWGEIILSVPYTAIKNGGEEMDLAIWITAIPSAVVGLVVWFFKRSLDQKDKDREAREKEREDLLIMMINSNRETQHLCIAIARAVQRIPDAKCNGDMTSALQRVEDVRHKEKQFLFSQAVRRWTERLCTEK